MTMQLPIHLLYLKLSVGLPEIVASPEHFDRGLVVIGLFWAAFCGCFALFFVTRKRGPAAAWERLTGLTTVLSGLLLAGMLWVLGDGMLPTNRDVYAMATLICIPAIALITIVPPSRRGRSLLTRVSPAVAPIGVLAYFAFRPHQADPALILLLLSELTFCLAAREFIQWLLDRWDEALQAALQSKTKFLVSASHDLGQPLQSARLSLYHVQQHDNPEVRAEAFRRMDLAFSAMETMVGQITAHLKLDEGHWQVNQGNVRLAGPIGRVIALGEAPARLKQVVLRASPTDLSAIGDADLIGRVLGNFVDNAIRHARARRILVAARRHAGKVRIWVIDDGEGVAAQDRPNLFEDFAQGDHKGEVRGGYGLGLGSARRMAELMNGSVGHDPRWAGGSAFFLELDAA